MIYSFTLAVLMFFSFDAGATTGGCVNVNNVPSPTSATSAAFLFCQTSGFNGSVPCNANTGVCTWNPVLYHQNYCNGSNLVSVFESNCPNGYSQVVYPSGVPVNPKFKCCRKGGPTPTSTPSPTPTSGAGKCCNPGGNPVPPMTGSTDQCKGSLAKPIGGMRR